jgi:transposase-like protein
VNLASLYVRIAFLHCAICNSEEVRVWIPQMREKPTCNHCGYEMPEEFP